MKITENRSFINIDAYAKHVDEKQPANTLKKNDSKGILKEDKVELSSVANKIREARKLIDSVPDIREQKIANIKTQIENGTYQINEEKIASRMLEESLLNDIS